MTQVIGKLAGATSGDLVLIVAGQGGVPVLEPGSAARVKPALDALRRTVAAKLGLIDKDTLKFAFIVDFPMFEWDHEGERWSALHHLFTSAKEEDLGLLETDPGAARSNAYDIICNGWEIGSGSIRIHRRGDQERILKLLGISDADARVKFGHMLDAFEFGAPPHGGFAPGIDRTVALFAQESDIREVIAFPKTKSAADLMTGAPSPVEPRSTPSGCRSSLRLTSHTDSCSIRAPRAAARSLRRERKYIFVGNHCGAVRETRQHIFLSESRKVQKQRFEVKVLGQRL
jgi:aspartyl-tRNA synthetase